MTQKIVTLEMVQEDLLRDSYQTIHNVCGTIVETRKIYTEFELSVNLKGLALCIGSLNERIRKLEEK